MFLTIGEKIKLSRKKYDLKQVLFEGYGITQYYLSLIENNKRVPSDEKIENIYQALLELTNGKIAIDYSLQEFKKDAKEQAKQWVYEQRKIRERYDEELLEVAKAFNLKKELFEIYKQFGEDAKKNKEYQKSNEYFHEAIHYVNGLNQSPMQLYITMGINLKNNLNYEGAIAYYTLALKYAVLDEDKYKVMYYLGFAEAQLNHFEKPLEYVKIILENSQNESVLIGSVILKNYILDKMSEFKQSRILLEEYIKNPISNLYLDGIYYNLACNYSRCNEYEKAKMICFYTLKQEAYLTTEVRYKTMLLIAHIYKKTKKYQDGIEFIRSLKEEILKEPEQRFISWFYETYIELLIELKLDDEIINLMIEVQDVVTQQKATSELLILIQSQLVKYAINTNKVEKFKKYIC